MEELKEIEIVDKRKKSLNLLHLNPLIKEDRIKAMLTSYTEEIGTCPFYDKDFKPHCKLNIPSNKKRNCKGRRFVEGFLCPSIIGKIVNSDKELEDCLKPTKLYK